MPKFARASTGRPTASKSITEANAPLNIYLEDFDVSPDASTPCNSGLKWEVPATAPAPAAAFAAQGDVSPAVSSPLLPQRLSPLLRKATESRMSVSELGVSGASGLSGSTGSGLGSSGASVCSASSITVLLQRVEKYRGRCRHLRKQLDDVQNKLIFRDVEVEDLQLQLRLSRVPASRLSRTAAHSSNAQASPSTPQPRVAMQPAEEDAGIALDAPGSPAAILTGMRKQHQTRRQTPGPRRSVAADLQADADEDMSTVVAPSDGMGGRKGLTLMDLGVVPSDPAVARVTDEQQQQQQQQQAVASILADALRQRDATAAAAADEGQGQQQARKRPREEEYSQASHDDCEDSSDDEREMSPREFKRRRKGSSADAEADAEVDSGGGADSGAGSSRTSDTGVLLASLLNAQAVNEHLQQQLAQIEEQLVAAEEAVDARDAVITDLRDALAESLRTSQRMAAAAATFEAVAARNAELENTNVELAILASVTKIDEEFAARKAVQREKEHEAAAELQEQQHEATANGHGDTNRTRIVPVCCPPVRDGNVEQLKDRIVDLERDVAAEKLSNKLLVQQMKELRNKASAKVAGQESQLTELRAQLAAAEAALARAAAAPKLAVQQAAAPQGDLTIAEPQDHQDAPMAGAIAAL